LSARQSRQQPRCLPVACFIVLCSCRHPQTTRCARRPQNGPARHKVQLCALLGCAQCRAIVGLLVGKLAGGWRCGLCGLCGAIKGGPAPACRIFPTSKSPGPWPTLWHFAPIKKPPAWGQSLHALHSQKAPAPARPTGTKRDTRPKRDSRTATLATKSAQQQHQPWQPVAGCERPRPGAALFYGSVWFAARGQKQAVKSSITSEDWRLAPPTCGHLATDLDRIPAPARDAGAVVVEQVGPIRTFVLSAAL
jgi:hypothetical protein